ncbi:hypothetical protein QFC22_004992 [Naganishia vaughanmartiniae]|uniref:Uncharacterized protein n=1 Tax=Naganishia vaughanmartiniae TaxID=1424756 RepID=A0ACC2WX01_9TREE|nr:hypothetical protein QFC22_004992 [Naganishia vaughanmartiniae]
MHPKNPYLNRPPNFDELGAEYPSFKPFVSHTEAGKPYIDFKNPAALRELTRSLLNKDFDLDVVLPEDRLTLKRNDLRPPAVNLVKVNHEDAPLLEIIAATNVEHGTNSPSTAKYLPLPNTWTCRPLERVRTRFTLPQLSVMVSDALRDAGIDVEWERMRSEVSGTSRYQEGDAGVQEGKSCSIAPTTVSWTRAARRKRLPEATATANPPLFSARIRIEQLGVAQTQKVGSPSRQTQTGDVGTLQVSLDWVKGRERAVVESLWAFLARKIGDAVRSQERT